MKVLLINGSPRQNGNTATALAEVAKQLTQEGIESEIVWIGNKPIRGCIACGQCKAKELGRCVFDDDICNSISEKFQESNALIVGSPVYYGQPNGALLSAINAENQQIIKQTPNFTPKYVKLGVFILYKTNHIRSENNLIKNRTNEKNNQFIFRKISYLCSK